MAAPQTIATANAEAIDAWNGVLFDRFVQYRHLLVHNLARFGTEALALHPPHAGDRVLDIGCGFGDASQQIAQIVGRDGYVLGVDAAERFIETARSEAEAAGLENVRFEVMDVETAHFPDRSFDYAFSRFGTMFVANPVAALRSVRRALVPGGRLCMVVWRRKLDNPWFYRAEQVVQRYLEEPEETDEPTCGPGPFSMANADTVSDQLGYAGFTDISLRRCDIEVRNGRDFDEAIACVTAIGPAGEIIRLAGEEAEKVRGEVEAALREELAEYVRADGVYATASTWIVSARVPEGA